MFNKTVMVTGSNGFVGTALVEKLLDEGYHVVAFIRDRNYKSHLPLGPRLSFYQGDITNQDDLRTCISKHEVDYIFHLASQPIVRICHSDPYSAYMTNVIGTLNLLESVRNLKRPPTKVVVLTSDKAYGPAPVPYFEDTPPKVGDSYATSKICQDFISLSYGRTYDLPIVVARASNIYGPGDLNVSRLIPRSILNLLNGQAPMLYDGVAKYIREFVHIDDVVSGLMTMMLKGGNGEAYNIGGGEKHHIEDVINLICDIINPEIRPQIEKKEFFEIQEQYLSGEKLEALGWSLTKNLREGLEDTIDYYKWWNERTNVKENHH